MSSIGEKENGWNEWSRYVLKTLETQQANVCNLTTEIHKLNSCMATIRTELSIKSGIWGLLGGAIPVIIALATLLIKK